MSNAATLFDAHSDLQFDSRSANSRRDFLRLSALLTGSLALPRLARAANPDDPVRIGYLPITDASALLVAHARQLFEHLGVIKSGLPIMLLRKMNQISKSSVRYERRAMAGLAKKARICCASGSSTSGSQS